MSPFLVEGNDILENMCLFTGQEINNISSIKSKKRTKELVAFENYMIIQFPIARKTSTWKLPTSSEAMDYIKSRAHFKTVDPSMANKIIDDWEDYKLV